MDPAFDQASRAILNNDVESLHSLLDSGAVSAHSADRLGNTLLHKAVLYNNSTAAGLLLKYGADPHTPNHIGETAATLATKKKNTDITLLISTFIQKTKPIEGDPPPVEEKEPPSAQESTQKNYLLKTNSGRPSRKERRATSFLF